MDPRTTFGILFATLVLAACDGTPPQQSRQQHTTQSQNVSEPDTAVSDSAEASGKKWPGIGKQPMVFVENEFTKNFEFIFDDSGSMVKAKCSGSLSKLEVAKEAVATFVAKVVPADANVGLYALNAGPLVPLGTGNRERFVGAVRDLRADNGTPLKSAMWDGFQELTAQGQRQRGYGEYNLVVVTDGEANMGQDPRPVVEHNFSRRVPITVYAIGFCIGSEHSLNQPGRTIYKEANNPKELKEGLEAVLAEAPDFSVTDFN